MISVSEPITTSSNTMRAPVRPHAPRCLHACSACMMASWPSRRRGRQLPTESEETTAVVDYRRRLSDGRRWVQWLHVYVILPSNTMHAMHGRSHAHSHRSLVRGGAVLSMNQSRRRQQQRHAVCGRRLLPHGCSWLTLQCMGECTSHFLLP